MSARVAWIGALLALAPLQVGAQLVVGTVTDAENGRRIDGARVALVAADGEVRRTVATRRSGDFYIEAGELRADDVLMVEQLGYETQRLQLGDLPTFSVFGMEVEVAIPPAPLVVEGVTATVRSERLVPELVRQGFYRRQRVHFGEYRIIDEVGRARAVEASDYLMGMQGVVLDAMPGRPMEKEPRLRRGGGVYGLSGGRCYPAIVLDGTVVRRSGPASESRVSNTTFDRVVGANHVQAIEVYASSQLPVRWGGLVGSCGAIVVWTR